MFFYDSLICSLLAFKDELDQLTALSPPPPPPEPTGPAMFDDLNDFLSGPPISAAPEVFRRVLLGRFSFLIVLICCLLIASLCAM